MFTRMRKIYHEFPRLFWIVVVVSFVDGIGSTLLFPFFASSRSSPCTSPRSLESA
jgi:hypothetical protein